MSAEVSDEISTLLSRGLQLFPGVIARHMLRWLDADANRKVWSIDNKVDLQPEDFAKMTDGLLDYLDEYVLHLARLVLHTVVKAGDFNALGIYKL